MGRGGIWTKKLPPKPDWAIIPESEDEATRRVYVTGLLSFLFIEILAEEIAVAGIIKIGSKFYRWVRPVDKAIDTAQNANRCAKNSGEWMRRAEGTRLKQVGIYWIKEVDPNASVIMQWWGKGSLNAQAKALASLDELAVSHLFKNGKLVMRDAGKIKGSRKEFFDLWLKGSRKLRTPFNDIRPRNMGASGLLFDPAWHPIAQRVVEGGIIYVFYKGGELIYLFVEGGSN